MKTRTCSFLLLISSLAVLSCWLIWVSRMVTIAASISCDWMSVQGASVCVVKVDLTDPRMRVTIEMADRGLGASERFGSIVKRTGPVAAATGTYFDTRTLLPVGDIVRDGKIVWRGVAGTAIAFAPGAAPALLSGKRSAFQLEQYETLLAAGPRLVAAGRVSLAPASEGFRQKGLFASRPRTAVGITRANKLLLVAVRTPVGLHGLARIMLSLGAVEAIALDGGTSTGLAYSGKVLVAPGRRLTNVLAVHLDQIPDKRQVGKLPAAQSVEPSKPARHQIREAAGQDGPTVQIAAGVPAAQDLSGWPLQVQSALPNVPGLSPPDFRSRCSPIR